MGTTASLFADEGDAQAPDGSPSRAADPGATGPEASVDPTSARTDAGPGRAPEPGDGGGSFADEVASVGDGPDARSGSAGGGGAADALLEGLNPAQREAVLHEDGPLLILAGAGSGKTRVITSRIAWLVHGRGFDPGEILAITFTNKAAGEMRERVARMGIDRGAWISTFHSMCARILRRDIEHLGPYTRDFTIYDTDDKNRLLREVVKRAGFDTTKFRPPAIGAWISAKKNGGERPTGELTLDVSDGLGMEDEVYERCFRDYEAEMAKNNALDFDDLLLKVIDLFEEHPGVRDSYSRRFRHVMVDEYQDTNRVQYRLVRHLAGHHGNPAVCGDPDQSIYAWRGADVRNILDFEVDFPNARVVRLEQNYRSTQNVLSAAQALIRNNSQRKEKELWSEKGDGERIVVTECADEDDEARETAFQIRSAADRGVSHDRMAIFYRVNFMQRALERALRLTGIPYQVVAGTEFFQRREIKDLVAYLRLLANPADDEACRRVVNVPARGVGDKSLDALMGWARSRGRSLADACSSEEARATIRGRAKSGLAAFAGLWERLKPFAEGPALVALDMVIDEIDYLTWLQRDAERDDVDREANVEELRTHARAYDEMQPDGGVRGFLQDIALVSDADGFEDDQPKVALMTLHTAKGLEFPYVFIAGLEEELLPHARAVAEGWDGESESPGIEEERRLLYVGMTRAMERLFLTHAQVRRHFGGDRFCSASRFLDEIPPELIEGGVSAEDEADALGEYVPEGSDDLKVGLWVMHDHFGRGRVEYLAGTGVNARATVAFVSHGSKQLLLQYARLKVIDGGRS